LDEVHTSGIEFTKKAVSLKRPVIRTLRAKTAARRLKSFMEVITCGSGVEFLRGNLEYGGVFHGNHRFFRSSYRLPTPCPILSVELLGAPLS
jgi:hypothetical protein